MKPEVSVSTRQAQKLSSLLRHLQPRAETFLNPQLFPPTTDAPEAILRFFFFTTSIDHRTSPPGLSFEGKVNNHYYHGADLLWHLSLRRYQQNPQTFSPYSMADITTQQIQQWFTVQHPVPVTIRNPGERARLLRNCGKILINKYNGSVLALLERANRRVSASTTGKSPGLLKLLSEFKAYEDPANKKSFLFIKFLLRRGLWSVTDQDQIRIPVDNHLIRVALRTGITSVKPSWAKQLKARQPFTLQQDIQLRRIVGDSYSYVTKYAQQSILELDDFFWHFGRNCCLIDTPVCVSGCSAKCIVATQLLREPCKKKCPLSSICLADQNSDRRALVEPTIKTWYY